MLSGNLLIFIFHKLLYVVSNEDFSKNLKWNFPVKSYRVYCIWELIFIFHKLLYVVLNEDFFKKIESETFLSNLIVFIILFENICQISE